jgi:hypothetical protein
MTVPTACESCTVPEPGDRAQLLERAGSTAEGCLLMGEHAEGGDDPVEAPKLHR